MNLLQELQNKQLISCPDFLPNNTILMSVTGSQAYGISTASSDKDIVGICIPPIEYIYQKGIHLYDTPSVWMEYQQHHVFDGPIEYDFKIYNIARFFFLAEQGNPNILDFVLGNESDVLIQHKLGKEIRDFGPNFCSKDSIPRYFGFAYNHFRDMNNKRIGTMKVPDKRKALYDKYGYDTKDASHCIRGILTLQDMLVDGVYKIDAHATFIRDIRNGLMTFQEALDFIRDKEQQVKELAKTSTLREHPDHELIRNKLISILYRYYIEKYTT